MPTTTTKHALPRPALTDPADGPDGFIQLTNALDPLISVYGSGTTGARPAAGKAGRFYWNTTTGSLEFDNGTVWTPVTGALSAAATLPVLDVGLSGQIRAGRQLTVADFTALGLSTPVGLFNLGSTANLGSGGTLVNKGTVPFGVGINGAATSAAQFAGSTAQALYIVDTGAADPFRIRTGSVGCWVRTAKRGTIQDAVSKWGTAGQVCFIVGIDPTNVGRWVISGDGTNGATAAGVSEIADDRWHFLVGTYDSTTVRLYVDGVLEATIATQGTPIFPGSSPLNIGGRAADAAVATTAPFYGRADEAFVTADVLSDDQIRALYCAKIPHGLGVTPSDVRLNVRRRLRGGTLLAADFPTQPVRLHNFTAGALTDEGSGAVALTNNGTALSVGGADGTPGGAFNFVAASSQSLSATDAGLPAALTARSYGCWFKSVTVAGNLMLMSWGSVNANVSTYLGNGNIISGNGTDSMTGMFVGDGQWHFMVVVEDNAAGDGVKRKLYVDGHVIVGSTVMVSLTLGGANRFRIGAQYDATSFFTGQLDGAFVCGYALTVEQIAALYAKGSQALAPSPKNPGDHVESMDATGVYATFDTLDSTAQVDLGVTA